MSSRGASGNCSQSLRTTLVRGCTHQMALEGTDDELLGEKFVVVRFLHTGGNSSGASFQFSYVNVAVQLAPVIV